MDNFDKQEWKMCFFSNTKGKNLQSHQILGGKLWFGKNKNRKEINQETLATCNLIKMGVTQKRLCKLNSDKPL